MSVLNKKLVRTGLECANQEEVMRLLAGLFFEQGLVRESFIQAVLERETIYPTALPAETCDIAIPHTMAEHVITPAVGVAVLNQGVAWQQMGSPDITLYPRLILMLAISDPKDQLDQLKKIMKLIQNKELLGQVIQAPDADAIIALLEPVLA